MLIPYKNKLILQDLYQYSQAPIYEYLQHYDTYDNKIYYIHHYFENDVFYTKLVIYDLIQKKIVNSILLNNLCIDIIIDVKIHNNYCHYIFYYTEEEKFKICYQKINITNNEVSSIETIYALADDETIYYSENFSNLIFIDNNIYFAGCIAKMKNKYDSYYGKDYSIKTYMFKKSGSAWDKTQLTDIKNVAFKGYKPISSFPSALTVSNSINILSPTWQSHFYNYYAKDFRVDVKKWTANTILSGYIEIAPSWTPDTIYYSTNPQYLWQPNHTYSIGNWIKFFNGSNDTIYNDMRYDVMWKCETAGKSGSSFPTSSDVSTPGKTITDGTVTWRVYIVRAYTLYSGISSGKSGSTEPTPFQYGEFIYFSTTDYQVYYTGGQGTRLRWLPNRRFVAGESIVHNSLAYIALTSGFTGSSAPTFPTIHKESVEDNQITWRCWNPEIILEPTTQYILSNLDSDYYIFPPSLYLTIHTQWTGKPVDDPDEHPIYFNIIEENDTTHPYQLSTLEGENKINYVSDITNDQQFFKYRISTTSNSYKNITGYNSKYIYLSHNYINAQNFESRYLKLTNDNDNFYLSIPLYLVNFYSRDNEDENGNPIIESIDELYKYSIGSLSYVASNHLIPYDYEDYFMHNYPIFILFINDYLYAIYYDWYNSDAEIYKIDSGLDDIVSTKQITENGNYISDVKYANYYPDLKELRIFFTSDYFSLANYNLESEEIQYVNFEPKKYEYGWDECVCYNLNYFVEKDNFKLIVIRFDPELSTNILELWTPPKAGGFFPFIWWYWWNENCGEEYDKNVYHETYKGKDPKRGI